MMWEIPNCPVKKNLKTLHSPGKEVAAFFLDLYRDQLVDFTPLGSTINADAYEETHKRL
jgi:hypothetical protein